MAQTAAGAGLAVWGLSDHVRADTTWLPEYERVIHELRVDGLEIRCGVEAKMLNGTGQLDLPGRLPALDYLLIADHQFPGADGPVHPDVIRQQVHAGRRSAVSAVEELVAATCAAVVGTPLPAVVVHPFSLLPKCGLSEELIDNQLLDALATACRASDTAVEVNEKWRCPSLRVLLGLAARGVRLCAGSDAHQVADVGAFAYLDELELAELSLESVRR
jgi:putative hydrolase